MYHLQPVKCALRGVLLTSPSLAQLPSLARYAGAAATPPRQGVGASAALPTWGAAALAVKPRCAAPDAGRPRALHTAVVLGLAGAQIRVG